MRRDPGDGFLWLRSPFYDLFAARTAKLMTEDTEQKAVKRALKRDGVAKGMFFNLLGQIAIVASGGLVSILLARHFDRKHGPGAYYGQPGEMR